MIHDIVEVIKNLQTLSENNGSFKVLKDFERVLEELDIYVFKNWENGELILGPKIGKYSVECTFMWDRKEMPDPQGGKRLSDYNCKIVYHKTHVLIPRKIKSPADYRPGTKKGKIDPHPVWTVTITMPIKLMQDVYVGKENRDQNRITEYMKYNMIPEVSNTSQEASGERSKITPTA